MGFFKAVAGKTKDGKSKMVMIHYAGLPNFPKKCNVDMILDADNNCLVFKIFNNKKANAITLPFSKITSVRNQSMAVSGDLGAMVGGAVIGTALFGALGGAIGAMKNDKKQVSKELYVITYMSNNESKTILLKQNGNLNFKKFQNELASYLENVVMTENIKNVTL